MNTKTSEPVGTDKNIVSLKNLSAKFRAAVVAFVEDKSEAAWVPSYLSTFPRGACGEVSTLLAKYLEQNKCGPFYYYHGRYNGRSHAWLGQQKLIVDITADQFEDQDCPVIVTEDHTWHAKFQGVREQIADFEQYDDLAKKRFQHIYKIIISKI